MCRSKLLNLKGLLSYLTACPSMSSGGDDAGPAAVATEQSMEKCGPAAAAADPGMKILVRQVLYNAVCGRPFSQYPDDILMLRHHGVAGRTAHHSEKFSPLVETAGAKLLRQMQQEHLAEVILGGLGVPSYLECICDAGTFGKWCSRASETCLLVGIVVSTKHGSEALFLDAMNERRMHVDRSKQTDCQSV